MLRRSPRLRCSIGSRRMAIIEGQWSDSISNGSSPHCSQMLANGWLKLGIDGRPSAAWNPIGGFTDAAGRLLWYAVGDPALLPAPHNSNWMANRFSPNIVIAGAAGDGFALPGDAVRPELS